MITKFKLYEDWENGIPEIGDWVVVMNRLPGKLAPDVIEYLLSQDKFEIKDVRKKESGNYLIDIGYISKITGEIFYYNFNRFMLIPSPDKNYKDTELFNVTKKFGDKIESIISSLDEIYNKIITLQDDLEIYAKADEETINEKYTQYFDEILNLWDKILEIFHLYGSNGIPFDDAHRKYIDIIVTLLEDGFNTLKDNDNIKLREIIWKKLNICISRLNRIMFIFGYKKSFRFK